ncbi:UNVERIFIED_CONTAM: hypothetical protein HDU68_007364 [Siphonaria sp. JEL0065]|nr:hypothetical protein HDU68_007364 [Siphonaria sp. JEL0065]
MGDRPVKTSVFPSLGSVVPNSAHKARLSRRAAAVQTLRNGLVGLNSNSGGVGLDRASTPSQSSTRSARSVNSASNSAWVDRKKPSPNPLEGPSSDAVSPLTSPLFPSPASSSIAVSPQQKPAVMFQDPDLAKLSISINYSGIAKLGYLDLDPVEAARLLYEELVPEVPREKMVEVLSKTDDFHKTVLPLYMTLLPTPFDLVSSLRGLCLRAPLKGEAQQIDRVISAFAERWWDVNGGPDVIYKSQDIVYGMVFSLVLLNTDMYSANVKTKMTVKAFITNTMHFVNSMLVEDAEGGALIAPMDQATEDAWRRDLETLLKEMYAAVRASPIIVQEKPAATTTPNRSRANTLASSNPFSLGNNVGGGAGASVGVYAPTSARRKPSLQFLNVNKRQSLNMEAAGTQSSPVSPSDPSARDFDFLPPQSITTIKPRSRFLSEFSQIVEQQEQQQRQKEQGEDKISEGVTLEGLLIRKQVQTTQGAKATFRAWIPLWCVLSISLSKGAELCMFEVEGENAKDDIFATESDWDVNSPTTGIQVPANRTPEVMSILHSHSKALPSPGYNQTRQHVFYLCLSDGSIMLFQTRTNYELRQWCDTLNFWAARWSMGPIRGGAMGSAEYGWTEFEWEAWKREGMASSSSVVQGLERDGSRDGGSRNGSEEFPRMSNVGGVGGGGVFSKRVDEWEVPRSSTLVVSTLTERQQVIMLGKQLKQIGIELENHLSYKAPMERKYLLNPVAKSRASANWQRKWNYLEEEKEKYQRYISVLSSAMRTTFKNGVVDYHLGDE